MEKAKEYISLAAFAIVPFGFISLGLIHVGQFYTFVLAGMLMLAAQARNNFVAAFGIYVFIWQVFIFLYAMVTPSAPKTLVILSYGQTIYIIIGLAVYYMTAKSRITNRLFFNVICVSALIQATICISQSLGFDPVPALISLWSKTEGKLPATMMTGSLGNPNFVGAYMAISIPFFLRKRWAWCLAVIIPTLVFTFSSSAMIPALIGLVIWWRPTREMMVRAAVACVVLCLAYAILIDNPVWLNDRPQFWMQAIKGVTATVFTAIFGMGPGASWGHPYPVHSEWIGTFHHFGLIGTAIMLGYFGTIGRRYFRGDVAGRNELKILIAALAIIAVNMAGNSALHYGPTSMLICTAAGLLEREMYAAA